MKLCAIIPSHNHYSGIGAIVTKLRTLGLPVFIMDDGSGEPAQSALAALHDPARRVYVQRMEHNEGKGAAVIAGIYWAIREGFTHALQIDADGQHDLQAVENLIARARLHPEALISGVPVYDETAPRSRKIGRWVTHIWVWIETLSFRISDSMCGLRIYPLATVGQLLETENIGAHMQFDTEIMVRLFWRGVAPVMVPVRVIYPENNTSNFQLWRDNLRISWMHTRLFCAMLTRLPSILRHRPPLIKGNPHWSRLSERGTYLGLLLTARLCTVFGKQICFALLMPIILYFYLSGMKQRHAIKLFLTRALRRPIRMRDPFHLYKNFFERSLDVFLAWIGKMPIDSVVSASGVDSQKLFDGPRGSLIVVSHLGNSNIAHALLPSAQRKKVIVLTHTAHAAHFNHVLSSFNPDAAMNIHQVTEIGPETIIALKQQIDSGAHIVIAGDRTPVLSHGHTEAVSFLSAQAPFPHGPWILAALMECPCSLLFCMKQGDRYHLTIEPFADPVTLPRETRSTALRAYIERYAARLEQYAVTYPDQWYNFFDFWTPQ